MGFIKAIKAIGAGRHGGAWPSASVGARVRDLQGSGAAGCRQTREHMARACVRGLVVSAGVLLAACSSGTSDRQVLQGTQAQTAFGGFVVADEPRAALIGREILAQGGHAADAAAAMGFALAVTLPSSAGLGGGGVCTVWDDTEKKALVLDFLPRGPEGRVGGGYPVALPGTARGLFALQSRLGRLRWEQVVAPAEGLARFGVRTSRALAREFDLARAALVREPETMRIFGRGGGAGLLSEGDHLEQLDLAAILGRLRARGAGDFYTGETARQYIEAVEAGGGVLEAAALRDYVPRWTDPVAVPFGDRTAYFAPPPAAAGLVAADMFAMLVDDDRFEDGDDIERRHLLAEAWTRGFGDRTNWMRRDGTSVVAPSRVVFPARIADMMKTYTPDRHTPADSLTPAPKAQVENPSAASFVAVDGDGGAVACAVTLGNPFGIGRMARGTGVLPAAVPDVAGRGFLALGPMVVGNPNTGAFYFAGAASGGITATTGLTAVAADVLLGDADLKTAMDRKRIHTSGDPDIVYYEQGLDASLIQALSDRGHRLGATSSLGRVAAALCPKGLPPNFSTCRAVSDPRGHGLAADVR